MEVRDVKPGQIFETLTDEGTPTGNVFKATNTTREAGAGDGRYRQIKAYMRFRQGPAWVASHNLCRILYSALLEGADTF